MSETNKYPWMHRRVPNGFWSKKSNRIEYMKWLGARLNYNLPDDWYGLTQEKIRINYGHGLLNKHAGGSHFVLLKEYMPDYEWQAWRFGTVPRNYWANENNRRSYIKHVLPDNPEEWYVLRRQDFQNTGGASLLSFYFDDSISSIAKWAFPNYDWKEWLFNMIPSHFFDNASNRKRYVCWLGERLGYSNANDWYAITQKDFTDHNGHWFLNNYYDNCPARAVMNNVDYTFKPWLFNRVPKCWWKDKNNVVLYLNDLANKLGYVELHDWYQVTAIDFKKHHGSGLLKEYNDSPAAIIATAFPSYQWNIENFAYGMKRQKRIYLLCKKFWSEYKVIWNHKAINMRYQSSGYPMELDIYIPEKKLAIEYQGEHHYIAFPYCGGIDGLRKRQANDVEKNCACAKAGVKLIKIPYYHWDGTEHQLKMLLENDHVRCS